MGIPHPRTKGGPPAEVPLLVAYLRSHPEFSIRTFYYGSRHNGVEAQESIPIKVLATLTTYIEFLWHLAIFKPHVIHINTAFGSYSLLRDAPFALTAWLFRLKLLFKMHGSLDEIVHSPSPTIRSLSWVFFKGASIVGVLSETERREFQSRYGNKVRLVKNIISSSITNRDNQYAFPPDCIYGLFVSRIDPRKGLSDLIAALPSIVSEVPSFRIIVAGDGPSMEECRQAAEKNGSHQYIYWLGWVDADSLGELFSIAHVFIFPTNYPEGMPIALLSAMQAGLPIVTTKCRFVNDFLVEGKNYVAINKGDPADMHRQVVRLLNDPELQNRMRVENPLFVNGYGIETVGEEFVRLYNELTGRNTHSE
jgi:glycosyltransferase involved in cell wall biosynthesis